MKIRHAVNVGEIAARSDFSLLLDTYAQKAFKMEKKIGKLRAGKSDSVIYQ